MAIKRYNSEKDNTIINALKENLSSRGSKANLGASDILEVFSIFGQASTSSLEQSRILVQFPISNISSDRDNGNIPESGSVIYKLKMSNTPHGQTIPKDFVLVVHPLAVQWQEGTGLDMESYSDKGASNWVSSSANAEWHSQGSDYLTASYLNPSVSTEIVKCLRTEGLELDITDIQKVDNSP